MTSRSPESVTLWPSASRRGSRSAIRIAEGATSTPRRPAPRSTGTLSFSLVRFLVAIGRRSLATPRASAPPPPRAWRAPPHPSTYDAAVRRSTRHDHSGGLLRRAAERKRVADLGGRESYPDGRSQRQVEPTMERGEHDVRGTGQLDVAREHDVHRTPPRDLDLLRHEALASDRDRGLERLLPAPHPVQGGDREQQRNRDEPKFH